MNLHEHNTVIIFTTYKNYPIPVQFTIVLLSTAHRGLTIPFINFATNKINEQLTKIPHIRKTRITCPTIIFSRQGTTIYRYKSSYIRYILHLHPNPKYQMHRENIKICQDTSQITYSKDSRRWSVQLILGPHLRL